VSSRLTFLDHQLVVFKPYYHWADIKRFVMDPTVGDQDLLSALIETDEYHDHYAGQTTVEQKHHSLHGPYELAAITPGLYEKSSTGEARDRMRDWLSAWLDGNPERFGVLAQFHEVVLPHLDGDAVYRLPELRSIAEHEWGWVVGVDGFHEFVVLDHANRLLTLFVASDD
jgi:hypothetical protein